jgi:hypothetical protein
MDDLMDMDVREELSKPDFQKVTKKIIKDKI